MEAIARYRCYCSFMARPALSPHGTINIRATLPVHLCKEVDRAAEDRGVKRSAMIRQILADQLNWSEESQTA